MYCPQHLVPIEPIEAITGVKESTAEACVGFVARVGLVGRCSYVGVNVAVGVERHSRWAQTLCHTHSLLRAFILVTKVLRPAITLGKYRSDGM